MAIPSIEAGITHAASGASTSTCRTSLVVRNMNPKIIAPISGTQNQGLTKTRAIAAGMIGDALVT